MIYLEEVKEGKFKIEDTDYPGNFWMYTSKKEVLSVYYRSLKIALFNDNDADALVKKAKALFKSKFNKKRSTL